MPAPKRARGFPSMTARTRQALQLNLPTTPVHDLLIHGDDLVVATHGRAFWVLDDISPLRQANASIVGEEAHLFTSRAAIRTRMGHTKTPPLRHRRKSPPTARRSTTI